MTLAETLDAIERRNRNGMWVPASGGTEEPFMVRGRRVQYLWQPSTGAHAYLDCDTDLILTDDDVWHLFATTQGDDQ